MLNKDFFSRTALDLAPDLLGKILIHETPEGAASGFIVETEAYMGTSDRGSHSFSGVPTARTNVMFTTVGHSYVYQIYGRNFLINVTCGLKENVPQCVLIRALQPIDGIDLMRKRRGKSDFYALTDGPSKLCKALDIDKSQYGLNLLNSSVRIEEGELISSDLIVCGPRIGIDYAGDHAYLPWRFWIRGNPHVSR